MTKTSFYSLFFVLGIGLNAQVLAVDQPAAGANGGPCLTDSQPQCIDNNARCSPEAICRCDIQQDYVDVTGLCRKQSGSLGSSCLDKPDCFDANSICSSATCQCGPGFDPEGNICNPLTTTCTLNCTDGKVCVVDPSDGVQRCKCPQGSAGPECQFPDLCKVSPCPEGASCYVMSAEERVCICTPDLFHSDCTPLQPEGEIGGRCLVNADIQCNDVHAICAADVLCICDQMMGYVNTSGVCQLADTSTTFTETTTSAPAICNIICTNGGSCVIDHVNGDRCECPQDFAGPTCEFDNLCLTQPCPEGKECIINDIGEKVCQCLPDTICYNVTEGCSGVFKVCFYTEHCTEVKCSANGTEKSSCVIPGADIITGVQVVNQISSTQCTYGKTYWTLLSNIWVDQGCSAMFNVCFISGSSTAVSTTEMFSTSTTSSAVCSLDCQNGGSCRYESVYWCDCPPQYTGLYCESHIDHCINNPCTTGATCLIDASTTAGYICICPGDFKGLNCDQADPLVTCRDTNRTLYLEQQPSTGDRTICFPKSGGDVNAVCTDPAENLVYTVKGLDDTLVRVDDFSDRYCIEYYVTYAVMPDYCIIVTAYEEDDRINRPWRNANATVCFIFNRRPEFMGPLEIRLNLPDMASSELRDLSARDLDAHQVLNLSFSIEVQQEQYAYLFSLTTTVGPVQLSILKPEAISPDPLEIDILVKVKDTGIPSLTDERIVKVKFTDRELLCDVNENPIYVHNGITQVPQEIGLITCGNTTGIVFSLQADGDLVNPFSVESATGALILNQPLQDGDYQINVKAEVFQPVGVVAFVPVVVKIGNWLPNCSMEYQPFGMSENAPVDACTVTVRICSNPSGKPVQCIDGQSELFRIECLPSEPKEIIFKMCAKTSLKDKVGEHTVDIILENDYGQTPVDIQVIVENVNDRPQLVKDTDYNFTVTEDIIVGYIIGTVGVADPDQQVQIGPPEVLKVDIVSQPSGSETQGLYPFNASLSTAQDYITIALAAKLDASVSRLYRFYLKVTDSGGLSDSVPIAVKVDDVNENPICDPSNYQASMSVHDDPQTVVAVLQCYDNDVEPTFKRIVYEVIGNQVITDHFAVNSSGVVTLRRPLTDVTDSVLTVTVKVADARGLETVNPVTITVAINSDFPPECSKTVITSSKSEATTENVCFTIETGCIEPVSSFPLTFEILSGNGLEIFRLDSKAPPNNNIGICTKSSLKNRYGDWTLIGTATSDFGSTNITIVISVSDINDPPMFTKSLYTSSVSEFSARGYRIVQVSATDPDSGGYGEVMYLSNEIESSPFFSLNSNDGWIFVDGDLDADIVGSNEYTFIIKAVDKGPPHDQNVTAQVVITVVDVNDNSPVCEQPQSTIPLFLLAKVNEEVYTVSCSDRDRSPEFNQLRYAIKSQSVDGTFTIDATTGTIRLLTSLSRDTPEHEVTIRVTDSTDPQTALSDEVNLRFAVNTTVPARCTPNVVTDSIPETKPNNFCLQHQVECVDVTGGDSIQLKPPDGNGTKYFIIRERQETKDGVTKLFLSACISDSVRNNFGTYTMVGIVDNGLAETTVIWNVTVTDLNEPPRFQPRVYETSIRENAKAGKILAVTVQDPDENSPEIKYRLANVTAKSLNDEDFGGALSDAIEFFNSTREFFVVVNGLLNATLRNEYTFQVKAMDGVGLQDTANVTINIADVNEPPICNEASVFFSTDILVIPGTVIGGLSCYDVDLEPNNKKLAYFIVNGDPDGYFNMTSDGSVIVAKQLPRLRLYNTGKAVLGIDVHDTGNPSLLTQVTAEIEVENRIPAVCNPVMQPPSTRWIQSSCLTVTMGCSDPTSPQSNSHLRYKVSGNYTQTNPAAFNRTGDVPAVFDLCYTLTTGGFYEIKVEVDNSLSIYTFKEVVEVRYEEATPVFTQATFKKTVTEFTGENTEVLTASATSSNLRGELLYSVVDAESTTNWNEYFTVDTSNGKVTTKKALKNLANNVMRLSVEVQDTKSKLKSSALVEITIKDENEDPECDIDITEVTIDVDAPVGEEVLAFSCSDPDVVPEYKQLTYALTGSTNVNVYFKLIPEAEKDKTAISLKSQLSALRSSYDNRVDGSKSSYYVTLEVSDNGNPAKRYTKRVTVIVSLLPPAVEWQILELGYSHVFVSWKYNRNDFYQVTTSFQVKLREQGSSDFFSTNVLTSDKRFDNVTGIKDNTEYEIFMSAVTEYGTRDTPISQIRTLEIPRLTKLTAIFKAVDIQFTDSLRNPASQAFKSVSKEISEAADFSLRESSGYVRTDAILYRPGSLVVEIAVYVNQTGNIADIRDLLAQIITSGYMGNLAVDSTFFYSSIDGGYLNVDTIELENENVYSGSAMGITCSTTTAGYEIDPEFRSWWTFNGNIIRPTSVSRITTDFYPGTVFPEIYTSVLEISSATPRDSGRYACYVADSEDRTSSKNIEVKVISPPVVLLTPRSLTVDSGSYVIITCTLAEPLDSDKDFQFLWYRNGTELQLQAGEEYNATTGTLSIPSMTVTTIFGCRGQNEAGNGPLVESHVGVKPSVEVAKSCPAETYRGVQWPETLPGLVAVANVCPAGYSGEFTRKCSVEGTNWLLPVDNCVQDRLKTIKEQVNTIKDGAGTTTLTESLRELDSATDNKDMYGGDLKTTVGILDDAETATSATGGDNETEQDQVDEAEAYMKVCSTLIDERHKLSWELTIENDGYGANEVSTVCGRYLKTKAEQLSRKINTTFEQVFDQKNIFALVGKEFDKSITFPNRASATLPNWVQDSDTKVRALKDTFKDLSAIVYDCVYYRNLTNKVVRTIKPSSSVSDVTKTLHFNAEIIGFNIQGKTRNLDPPIEIVYGLYDANYSDPVCVYWDTAEKYWSPDGCYVDSVSENSVNCKCDHFTNFAVLMSPGKTPPADAIALSIISAVGCAISMFCLVVTLVVHIAVWRVVKSDRAIILMNLCVALLIALALFLAGVGRTDNEDACTAIAVLLHYIFLVVFFLMLAEGIDIAVTILYVFATKSRIKWLIPLSWLIPAVIVAISAGVTQLEGYGNTTSCWLSVDSGLLWAFVGPAAFVILVNIIIIIIVFRQMFTSSAMLTKSDKEKAKTSLRSLCVLLPIMGITWVFGVFSVNESLVAFQYIFAIFNSLQGFFIFLFHCFLNKQLRDAIKQRRARKKSLQSFEKSYKNQHSTGTGSTAYQTSEDKSKDVNTDQGSKLSSTSNPFLEADRQMKELVSKGNKTGNTFDKVANNKKIDKDKPPVDVALEDVKISNILRESEVMSGTTGISSIFTNQPDVGRERETTVETPTEDKNKLRESKTSAHTYDYAVEPSYSYSGGLEKPAGYEKLLPQAQRPMSSGYDRVVRSDDNVSAGVYGGGRDSGSHGRGSRERLDENRDRLTGSTRSSDDFEARLQERQERINNVYMPYNRSAHVSSQEIGASLPKKYDMKQVMKPQPVKKGKTNIKDTGAVKKLSGKKKKEMEKDRSRMYQYQYPYEATYLGQQQHSRHSSLENMGGYYVNAGYSPYGGMQGQGQTGRPTHQHPTGRPAHHQQQYNPYGWGNQQRRDYW